MSVCCWKRVPQYRRFIYAFTLIAAAQASYHVVDIVANRSFILYPIVTAIIPGTDTDLFRMADGSGCDTARAAASSDEHDPGDIDEATPDHMGESS